MYAFLFDNKERRFLLCLLSFLWGLCLFTSVCPCFPAHLFWMLFCHSLLIWLSLLLLFLWHYFDLACLLASVLLWFICLYFFLFPFASFSSSFLSPLFPPFPLLSLNHTHRDVDTHDSLKQTQRYITFYRKESEILSICLLLKKT